MTLPEAIEGVSRMLACRANGQPANPKAYIGAISSALLTYPRSIAQACVDPVQGVLRDCRFTPELADVIAWCERRLEDMRSPIDREDRELRHRQYMAELRRDQEQLAEDRKTRPTLDELRERFGPNWGLRSIEEEAAARRLRTEQLTDANRRAFERECRAAGIAVTSTASPSLLKLLRQDAPPAQQEGQG